MRVDFDPNNPADVSAVLRLLGTDAPAPAPRPAPAPAPRPAPAPAPAPRPGPAPAPAPAPRPAPAPAPAPGGITQAQFSDAVQNYAKVYKPAGVKARLGEFGYKMISEVPADRYDELYPYFAV